MKAKKITLTRESVRPVTAEQLTNVSGGRLFVSYPSKRKTTKKRTS